LARKRRENDVIEAVINLVIQSLWFVVPFIFVLSVVVFIHELGHFLAGRLFGVKIETFSIGFGKELFGWVDRFGTRWRIAALPLGGYVKFWGDTDVTTSRADEEMLAKATAAERAGSFHHKPLIQKAVIAAAGPFANFVLALVVFAFINMVFGERILPPIVGEVTKSSPAEGAGIQAGDLIVKVNGRPIRSFTEFAKAESLSLNAPLALEILRGSETVSVSLLPRSEDRDDGQGGKVAVPAIGIQPFNPAYIGAVVPDSPAEKAGLKAGDLIALVNGEPIASFGSLAERIRAGKGAPVALAVEREGATLKITLSPLPKKAESGETQFQIGIQSGLETTGSKYKIETIYHGPLSAFAKAGSDVWFIVAKIGEFFGQLVTGSGDYRQLSGPIGIAKISSDVAQVSLVGLIHLIAVLSVSIGLLNLLPIPILDGGHLLFYAVEGIRGRPLGERAQEIGFQIGLAFMLGLMLVATWNDISRVKFWLF
jgi:regulator of sigma E protease